MKFNTPHSPRPAARHRVLRRERLAALPGVPAGAGGRPGRGGLLFPSDHASLLLFVRRFVWGAVWEDGYTKELSCLLA